jgi:hypothetical protein
MVFIENVKGWGIQVYTKEEGLMVQEGDRIKVVLIKTE